MFGRHIRKEPYHQGANEAGQHLEHAACLGHFHQTQKQGHHAHEAKGQLYRTGGRLHNGLRKGIHWGGGAIRPHPIQLMPSGGKKGNQHNGEKNDVHGIPCTRRIMSNVTARG